MTSTNPLYIILFAAFLSLLPLAFGMMTSFLKVNIVLGMLKNALGIQHAPGVIAEIALSGIITLFVMNPVFSAVIHNAENENYADWQSLKPSQILQRTTKVFEPWRQFLLTHSGDREIRLLVELSKDKKSYPSVEETQENNEKNLDQQSQEKEIVTSVLFGSFVLTELREAFLMSFILLLPFLVIDLIVAHLLTGLGMMMMSPVIISLPLKLILFVVADGWLLLTRSLILSYH
jgi:type III secretory pathway component EscR